MIVRSNVLTLRLTGSLIMAVSAFVFIGLNVTRLRLSRDLLDTYLLKAQRRIRQQVNSARLLCSQSD